MSKILVTGGAGYIGSHTIVELLRQNHEIVSVDNYSNSFPSSIANIKKISGKDFYHYELDLVNREALNSILDIHKDIEGVIHFAASIEVEDSVNHPLKYYRNNMVSLMNVLEQMRDRGISHFIFSSSCTVYGDLSQMPVHEETPTGRPASPYGATKQMGEQILADLVRNKSIPDAVVLRYFNPAGAHESALLGENPKHAVTHLIPVITQVASGERPFLSIFGDDYPTRDGSCIRDYVHVTDLARAHVLALKYSMDRPTGGCSYFNLGFGDGVTVKEAVKAFEDANQIAIPVRITARRAGDLPAIYADTSRARKILHWQPRLGLETIMRSAWKFEQNRSAFQ